MSASRGAQSFEPSHRTPPTQLKTSLSPTLAAVLKGASPASSSARSVERKSPLPFSHPAPPRVPPSLQLHALQTDSPKHSAGFVSSEPSSRSSSPQSPPSASPSPHSANPISVGRTLQGTLQAYSELAPPLHSAPKAHSPSGLSTFAPAFSSRLGSVSARTPSSGPPATAQKAAYRPVKGPIQCQPAALNYYLYTQPSPAQSVSSIQQRAHPTPPLPPAFPVSHPHPAPSSHAQTAYHPAHHPHHPNPNAFQPLPLERTYSEDSEVLSQTDSDHAFAHSLSLSPHSLSPVIGDRPLRQSASAHSQVSLPTIVDVDCSPLSSPFTVNPSPPVHAFNRIKSLSSAVPMRSAVDSSIAEAPAPTLKLRPGLAGGASSEGSQLTSSAGSSSSAGPSASTSTTTAARASSGDASGPSAGPSEPARPVLASPSHAAHVEPMHFHGRLLLIANRLPITFHKHSNGTWSHGPAAGGLVSAMKGVKAASMTWVGWPGTEIAESEQPAIVAKCKEINSFPVFLPKDMADLYYNGFSNHVLWPLFHYIHVNIEDTVDKLDKQWRAYIEANKLFCNAVLEVYEEGDIVWVHDYHLMLLPQFLRAARPTMKIGWFLHTPFPSSEIYRALPYREELLNGVLAADLLGFHIFDYGRHFKSACTRILGLEVTHQGVEHHGRFTQVGTFPIGIDAARFLAALEEEEVQREFADLQRKFKGMKVLLGIDRLDYIKGIPHKLLAVEKFLHHHPEWIGKVVLIQIAVPSRETVIEYQRLKSLTHELVGRVNGRFGTLESVPIHYLDQSVPFPKMCALYRLADLAIITSLRDGMNLVSYEYVVCQKGKAEAGVLILSEFAGAAQSLGAGSIRVNPWNTNQLAHAINQALQMPRDERNHLHQYAFGHITSYTAQRWAQQFIGELNNVCERVSTQLALVGNRWIAPRLVAEDVVSAFQQSRNRVVCLGVVGCLTQKRMRGVTVEQFGQMAQVPQETLDAIDRLSSDPNTTVLIMSALGRSVVDRLLGSTQAWLIPENGFFIRKGGRESQWEALGDNVDLSWIDEVEEVLNYFVQRTPRSFIEREESYLSWHYRDSDSEWAKLQVRDLLVHLMATPASSHGFEVVRGVKAIQIRPIGVSKGFAAQHCISEVQSARPDGVDFILCVGSFLFRDEDLFTSLLHVPAPGADKAELLEDAEAELGIGPEDPGLQLHSGAEVDDHEPGPSALGGSDGGESPSVNSITPTSLSHSPIAQHIITSSYLPPLALPAISDSPEPAAALPKPAPIQNAQGPSEAPSSSSSAPSLRPEGESSAAPTQEAGAPSEKSSVSSSSHPRQLGRSHSVFTFRGSQQQGPGSRKDLPTNALGTSFPSPRSYRAINAAPLKDHPHNAKRHVFTCTVGRNKPSRAQFHVNGLHEVSNLLQRLASTIPSPARTAHSAPSGSSAEAQAPALPSPEAPIHLAPTPSEAEAAGSQH